MVPGTRAADTDRRAEPAPRAGLRGLRLVMVAPHAPPVGGMSVQADLVAAHAAREGAVVRRVASNPPVGPLGAVPWLGGALRLLAHRRDLRSALRCGGDVLHVHSASWAYFHRITAPALREGRAAGLRTVLRWDGGEADRFFATDPAGIRRAMAPADRIVVQSGWLAEVFARRLGLDVTIVPNLVERPGVLRRDAPRTGPLRLLCARHLSAEYGIDVVLRAAAVAAEHGVLHVAGDGPDRAALERLAATLLGDRVRFLGRVPRERVLDELATTDLVVNGSSVDNFPVALAEALAAGVPVATTSAGGIPWIVRHDEVGIVTDVGDAAALGAAIVRLARDEPLRRTLGQRAAVAARAWTWDALRGPWAECWSA